MRRLPASTLGLILVVAASSATAAPSRGIGSERQAPLSGMAEYGARDFGPYITECPQAGLQGNTKVPHPLDQREIDRVEQLSQTGDDVRANTDYSCFPQNETSVAVNPLVDRNIISGQNDYRTLSRQGFNSTTDNGNLWYSAELPPLSVPDGDILDASGDPVYVFDAEGVAYAAAINFNRTDDENGITVQRSTNGGFTWTRPCVPIPGGAPDPDEGARCGGPGDPRTPGEGIVTYIEDPDNQFCAGPCPPFDDKEWLAAGPRPAGVEPVCFSPVEREPEACDPAVVGVGRLYVTWTRFTDVDARILISYSDDQGRSWSPPRAISGSAPFCQFGAVPGACDSNQFSVPTVHPTTGLLGVAFENFNTPDENQYLFVRSRDGGATFEGPFFVTPVFDVNYPTAGGMGGRPDCTARGQQTGRRVLTNTCFRVNAGGNVVVDKRGGAFADDFYLVMSDNRNGTRASSNTDVFFFKSTDGGSTWIGPSRVNNDRSDLGGVSRDCDPGDPMDPDAEECLGNFGNDQWFPWMDVSPEGVLAFGFHDRRLDRDSVASEWPMSRQRPGNYLAWFWGAGCRVTKTADVTQTTISIPAGAGECLSPGADVIEQPPGPINPGPDPVPGQGATFLGPFANQRISDVPFNLDYSFRAGIFMGDYNAVAFPNVPGGAGGNGARQAVAFWTDARNGRGSGGAMSNQPGRNPACEQSDVFLDFFNPLANAPTTDSTPQEPFLVTPCPSDALR